MGLSDAYVVGQKDHVELAAFGSLRELSVMLEIDTGVGLRFIVPPRRDVMSRRIEERS
jgi:hypothetical protein